MERNCREVIFSVLGIDAYFKKKPKRIHLFRLLTPCLKHRRTVLVFSSAEQSASRVDFAEM